MSPRTAEEVLTIRQKSVARIVEATLQCFALKGYHSTSISDIAKAAGISKGLIYNYFSSKRDLIRAIFDKALHEAEPMYPMLARTVDAKSAFYLLIDQVFESIKTNPSFWRFLLMISMQEEVRDEISAYVLPQKERMEEALARLLVDLGAEDGRLEARLLAATLDGVFLQYLFGPEDCPLDQLKDLIKIRFLHTYA